MARKTGKNMMTMAHKQEIIQFRMGMLHSISEQQWIKMEKQLMSLSVAR